MTNPLMILKLGLRKHFKTVLLSTGGFVIILLIAGGVCWYRAGQMSDCLLGWAPVNSVVYASARDSVWPEKKSEIADLPLSAYFSLVQEKVGLSADDLEKMLLVSRRMSLVAFLNENNGLDYALLAKLKEFKSAKPDFPSGPNVYLDKKNILIVAGSPAALQAVKAAGQGAIFSLRLRADGGQTAWGLINLYVSAGSMKTYLAQSADFKTVFLGGLLDSDLQLNIFKKNDSWQFKLTGNIFAESRRGPRLVNNLPPDFVFYASGIRLSALFDKIKSAERKVSGALNLLAANLKNNNEADANDLTEPFLSQPADLIVFNPGNGNLGFDYIVAWPQTVPDQPAKLKFLIKLFLAVRLPQEVSRQLPDQSLVTELTVNPEQWQWQNDLISKNLLPVSYLKVPALNWEFALAEKEDVVYLSSSLSGLENYLSAEGIAVKSFIDQCRSPWLVGNYLIWNNSRGSTTTSGLLPAGVIVGYEAKKGIKGCYQGF